jgi:hypothetical protein
MSNNKNLQNYIATSRDELRYQLSEYLKEYLQLSDIEIRRSSVLGYLIDVLAYLTSNVLMYSTMVHKESNLITASLPESIYDLSAYIGYSPKLATPSQVDALIQFKLQDIKNSQIVIPKGFKCEADSISFILENECIIDVVGSVIKVILNTSEGRITLPYYYDQDNDIISVSLNMKQYDISNHEFNIPSDLKPFQFYNQIIPITSGKYLYDIKVSINDEEWTFFNNLFEMNSSDKGYTYRFTDNGIMLYFGNGLFGKQPTPSGIMKVEIKEIVGKRGNIIPGKLNKGQRLYKYTGQTLLDINYEITNINPGHSGNDQETVEETKRNAIINLRALNRLVSEDDYRNISKIIDLPIKDTVSVLKRSDVKINEICLYTLLQYFEGEYTPTITHYLEIEPTTTVIKPFTIFNINNIDYYTLFELVPDFDSLETQYYYYARDIDLNLVVDKIDIDEYPFNIKTFNVKSDYDNRIFKCYLEVDYDETVIDISQIQITTKLKQGDFTKDLEFQYINDTVNDKKYFYYEFSFDDIPFAYIDTKILIWYTPANEYIAQYTTNLNIKLDLFNFSRSQMKVTWVNPNDETDKKYTIYDVPLIKKEWFDALSEAESSGIDLRKHFEMVVINNFIESIDTKQIRMLNTYVNNKFVSTECELTNILLNESTFKVYERVTSRSEITKDTLVYGDMFLLNGPLLEDGETTDYIRIVDTNDPFYRKETYIAKFIKYDNNGEEVWEFIEPIVSQSVFIQSEDTLLYYDGNEWFKPHIQTPLEIEVVAYLENFSLSYADYIREKVYNYFKENMEGINSNVYRSQLIRFIQDLDNVVYVKLLKPKIDLLFDFNIDKILPEQMLTYSPQLVTTLLDKIKVRVESARTRL